MKPRSWSAIDAFGTSEACEAIEYGVTEAGALGTEANEMGDGRVKVTGYFDNPPEIEAVQAVLLDALRVYNLETDSLVDIQLREIEDRDWLADWKKDWRPVEVGRFIIAPPWSEITPAGDRIVIRIEPGMAFGTGTHETTRLCLKGVEKHFRGGSFLDVGTGTGILAIAAAKMFTESHVEACDTDADAVAIAKENARLNAVAEQIDFLVGTVDQQTSSADLVCANLTAPVIVELLPALLGATCGRLVLAGILDSQLEMIRSRLIEFGALDFEIDQDGEWIALVV